MGIIDDWHDWWRLLDAMICGPVVLILFALWARNHWSWTQEIKNVWFVVVSWTSIGALSSIEGILRDAEYSFRLFMIMFCGLATAGILRKHTIFDEYRNKNVH